MLPKSYHNRVRRTYPRDVLRYAITDRTLTLSAGQGEHEGLIAAAVQMALRGVEFLLIREKDLPARELAQLSRKTIEAVRRVSPSTRILIAERLDVAATVGADGVHLSSRPGELSVDEVRRVFRGTAGEEPFVSLACHSLEEVRHARDQEASAALFAPVFGKLVGGTLVSPGVGLKQLHDACVEARSMPVFALGGVTNANAEECLAAGAAGVAGIRMFFAPERRNKAAI